MKSRKNNQKIYKSFKNNKNRSEIEQNLSHYSKLLPNFNTTKVQIRTLRHGGYFNDHNLMIFIILNDFTK